MFRVNCLLVGFQNIYKKLYSKTYCYKKADHVDRNMLAVGIDDLKVFVNKLQSVNNPSSAP